jgi:hypothetical protein
MPIIYMRHPIHGAKVATMELEAEYDERNGWARYTPGQDDDVEPALAVNALTERPRRRREVVHVHHSG